MSKISRYEFISMTSATAAAFACGPTRVFSIETTNKDQSRPSFGKPLESKN